MKALIVQILSRLVHRRATVVDIEQRSDTFQNFKYGDFVEVTGGDYENLIGEIIRPKLFRVKKLKVRLEIDEEVWIHPSDLKILKN